MDFSTLMRVFWARQCMRGRDYWRRERIEDYQLERLDALRKHTYQTSPFYQAFHRGLETAPLSSLPVLTKQRLMHYYDDVVTDRRIRLADIYAHMAKSDAASRLFLDKYRIIVTSGSSGSPGVFIFDPWAWAQIIAMEFRILEFANVRSHLNRRSRCACITSASPWHQSWQIAHTLTDKASGSYLYLSAQESLSLLVDKLNQFQPSSLISYANVIYQLAEEKHAARLTISPSTIYCGGEALSDDMRARIRSAFKEDPYNLYGLTEGGNVASDCTYRSGMHINEDFVILENVDDDYEPVAPGKLGSRVLLTVLFNNVLPIIRYEISDNLAITHDPCACGRVFRRISTIEGRIEDALSLFDQSGETTSIHPNFFHELLDTEPVIAWQIIEGDNELTLRVVPSSSTPLNEAALTRKIEEALKNAQIKPIAIKVQQAQELMKGKTGKTKLIIAKSS